MTIPVQDAVTSSVANGVTTVFPFGFKILSEADLLVTLDDVEATTGFTVSGVGDETGGNVTFSVAPANGVKVTRALQPELKRDVDYQQFGDWLSPEVNNDFDRIWLALQMLNHNDKRSLRLSIDNTIDQTIMETPAERARKIIGFDVSGNVILYASSDIDTALVSALIVNFLAATTQADARSAIGIDNTLTAKTTPVDVDEFTIFDSAASWAMKKMTWSNIKAGIWSALGGLIGTGTGKATPVDADYLPMMDSAASNATKSLSWANIKATLKTYFDTLYQRTLATAQATTSGTSIDFTGIPATVKRITIMFNGVSTNGASPVTVKLGTSGGVESSGYFGLAANLGTSAAAYANISSGFDVMQSGGAAVVFYGQMTLCLLGSNTWTCTSSVGRTDNTFLGSCQGAKTLSGVLDRVRITTVGGTDTFDAGSINILYE